MENKKEIAKFDTTNNPSYTFPEKWDGSGNNMPWLKFIPDLRDKLRNQKIDVAYTLNKTPNGFIYGIMYKVPSRDGYEQALIFFENASICNSGSRIKRALDDLKNAFNKDAVDENEVKNICNEIGNHCGNLSFFNFKNEQEKNDKIGFVVCTSGQDIEKFLQYPDQKEYNDCKIVCAYQSGGNNQYNDKEKEIKPAQIKKYWGIGNLPNGVSLPGTQTRVYEGDKIKVRYSKQGCEHVEESVYVDDNNESKHFKIVKNEVIFKSAEEIGIEFQRKIKLNSEVNLNYDAIILLDKKEIELDDKNCIRVNDDGAIHTLTINKTGYESKSYDIELNQESINIELKKKEITKQFKLPNGNSVKVTGGKQDIECLERIVKGYKQPSNLPQKDDGSSNDKRGGGSENKGKKQSGGTNREKSNIAVKTITVVVIGLVIGTIGCYIFMKSQKNESANYQDYKEALEDSIKNDFAAILYLKEKDTWLNDDSKLTGTPYDKLPSYFVNGKIDSIINSPYNKIEEELKNYYFKQIVDTLKEIKSDSKKKKVAQDIKDVCKENKSNVDLKKIGESFKKKMNEPGDSSQGGGSRTKLKSKAPHKEEKAKKKEENNKTGSTQEEVSGKEDDKKQDTSTSEKKDNRQTNL